MLSDIDKVFAMLDGKQAPVNSLVALFEKQYQNLIAGQRLSSDYFDVRYYPGVGTIHFFPRDKQLIDQLNRVVGRRRAWLPSESQPANEGFWKQYEQAERMDADVRKEFKRIAGEAAVGFRHHLSINEAVNGNAEHDSEAMQLLHRATASTAQRFGIDVEQALTAPQARTLLLETAGAMA